MDWAGRMFGLDYVFMTATGNGGGVIQVSTFLLLWVKSMVGLTTWFPRELSSVYCR